MIAHSDDPQVRPRCEEPLSTEQKFDQLYRIVVELGFADGEIARRVEERVASELRSRFGVIESESPDTRPLGQDAVSGAAGVESDFSASQPGVDLSEHDTANRTVDAEPHPIDESAISLLRHDEPPAESWLAQFMQ